MSNQSNEFTFSDVQWINSVSKEISQNPSLSIRTGVKSATILCNACNNKWHATQYDINNLRNTNGGVNVTCPSCHAEKLMNLESFE